MAHNSILLPRQTTLAPSVDIPLRDVTLSRLSSENQVLVGKPSTVAGTTPATPSLTVTAETQVKPKRSNNPYNWDWRAAPGARTPAVPEVMTLVADDTPLSEPASPLHDTDDVPLGCTALVQFKCHHGEYSASLPLAKGQYVVVEGDRGIDIGVVIRVNTSEAKQYVERSGPTANVIRYATQREVDYWATDLKSDEAVALEYCRQRVQRHRLMMDVRYAEYQFDKKKLTFYYDARSRVDFITLNKELFREFSCRIWMEKVRSHE